MTPEQKQAYLKDPNSCPFCNSPAIDADHFEIDGTSGSQKVTCGDCGREWYDVYSLIGVEEK